LFAHLLYLAVKLIFSSGFLFYYYYLFIFIFFKQHTPNIVR